MTVTAGSRGDEAASGAAGSEVDDTVAGGNDDVTFEAKYDGGSSSAGGDLSGMYTGFTTSKYNTHTSVKRYSQDNCF